MASPFQLSGPPGGTTGELSARAGITANSDWFAARSNWAQVESFCSACGSSRLLKSLGAPAYNSINRPNPVISSIDVKSQGNLGTTRQASFKILAFTEDQFQDIVNCYGVPGMTARVQFGWSIGANGQYSTPIAGAKSDVAAICDMNGKAASSGIYDGLQGVISKYAITFVKDLMAWEMTVNIIASSTPVLGRPLEDFSDPCYCETTSVKVDKGGTKTEEKRNQALSQIRAQLVEAIKNAAPSLGAKAKALFAGSSISLPGGFYKIHLYHAPRDADGNDNSSWVSSLTSVFGDDPECDEAYLSFGTLENLINQYSLPQAGGGPAIAKLDSSTVGLLTYKSPGYSSDPDICLFPGCDGERGEDGYKGISSAPSCLSGNGIDVTKILINCIFANKCISDIGPQGTVGDFLEKILQGINQAAAGLFELTVIDSGVCGSDNAKLSVMDIQKAEGSAGGFSVSIGPKSAVARDVKLELELTEAMTTQAIYGGKNDSATTSICDDKKWKKILNSVTDGAKPTPPTKPQSNCPTTCTGEKLSLEQAYTNMVYDDGISDSTKESVKSLLVETYNKGAENDICKQTPLPWKLSFTTDGVGGFKFGQVVSTNILPSSAGNLIFQVTSVEHSVTYGDWTTTVNTIGRPA